MEGLAYWEAAKEQLEGLAGDELWRPPPPVPTEVVQHLALDPTGRTALVCGYGAVHLLDLATMRSRVLVDDRRLEREGIYSADGGRAAVLDRHGKRLHRIDVATAEVETVEGVPAGQLRRRARRWLGPRGKRSSGWRSPDGVQTLAIHRGRGDPRLVLASSGTRVGALEPVFGGGWTAIDAWAFAADGRPLVVGTARTDPLRDDEGPALHVFAAGDEPRPLGVVLLAVRSMVLTRVQVQVEGRRLSLDEIKAMGVTINKPWTRAERRAQERYLAPEGESPAERPFGRTVAGLFGRLDRDAPLGPRLTSPLERPEAVRRLLLGDGDDEALPPDARAAFRDYATRVDFWTRSADQEVDLLVWVSAGITHLLPEVVHGVDRRSTRALVEACKRAQDFGEEQREAVFAAVGERLERLELRARLDEGGADETALAAASAEAPIEVLRSLADATEILDLSGRPGGAAALGVLVAAGSRFEQLSALLLADCGLGPSEMELLASAQLPSLTRLVLNGNPLADGGVVALAAGDWPALSTLDLRGTGIGSVGECALAGSPGLPALESLLLPLVSARGAAALYFGRGLTVESSVGPSRRESAAALVADTDVDPVLRLKVLRRAFGQGDSRDELVLRRLWRGVASALRSLDLSGIRRLALRDCQLHDRDLRLLDLPASLERLDLAENRISDAGARALASTGLPRLRELDLSGNQVEDAGACALLALEGVRVTLDHCPLMPVGQLASRFLAGREIEPELLADNMAELLTATGIPDDDRRRLLERVLEAAPEQAARVLAAWPEVVPLRLLECDAVVAEAERPEAGNLRLRLATRWLQEADPCRFRLGRVRCRITEEELEIGRDDPPELEIRAEPQLATVRKLVAGQDLLTGDPAFDKVALIAGDPAEAALLAPELRGQLPVCLRWGARFEQGWLRIPRRVLSAEKLAALLRVAQLLSAHPDPVAGLVAARQTEPLATVRARQSEVLGEQEACRPEHLAAAATDEDPRVQRAAGAALAARAADWWCDELPEPLVLAALPQLAPGWKIRAVGWLGAHGTERAVAPLAEAGSGLFVAGPLKEAVREATGLLLARLGPLRAGGLSVTDDEGGGLSFEQGAGEGLSFADEE